MGALCFVCPTSGRKVVTVLEVDLVSLAALHIHQVGCPECGRMHRIEEVGAWMAGEPSTLSADDPIRSSNTGTLRFVCPDGGHEVDTGILIDPISLDAIRGEQLGCPECLGVHHLSQIKTWVDKGPLGRAE